MCEVHKILYGRPLSVDPALICDSFSQLMPAGHFPFQRFNEPSHSRPFDVITFNPAVNYEQEDGDVTAHPDELFPEMQITGREDLQQLL